MKENKMGYLPMQKLIVSISVPIIISMLIQALYNVVDSMYVAQIGEDALTALSLVFPIQNLMISVAVGTGVGMNALLSKSLGQKDTSRASEIAKHGVLLSLLSSVVFILFALFASSYYFEVQNVTSQVYEYGMQYIRICCTFSVFIFLQVSFERLLQATGRSMFSMISQAMGAIVNIVLDPILIFGWFGLPAMGVEGAALATIIGQFVGCSVGYLCNHHYNHEIHLSLVNFKVDVKIIKEIYVIGVPSIIMSSISSVLTFAMNQILLEFSQTATALFGVYIKLQSFAYMPVYGLTNGLIPIIAYNYGAKHKDRIISAIKYGCLYATVMLCFVFIIFQFLPALTLTMFNASNVMLSMGVVALRIISIHFLIAGISMVFSASFQSLGHSFTAMMITVLRQLGLLIPLAYLFSLTNNINYVWLAYPIAEVIGFIICIICMRKIYKKEIMNI